MRSRSVYVRSLNINRLRKANAVPVTTLHALIQRRFVMDREPHDKHYLF
jgi:hypothetical protein